MSREVKLKDIASELNVSIVTVSNALSGKKGVSDSVRKQVIEKAKEMGYNTTKYEKKAEPTVRIGVIVSEKYLEVGASFYWALYQQVAYMASKKNSFTIFDVLESKKEEQKELPKILSEEGIDGIIIIGWMEHDYVKKMVESTKIPVVLLDFHIDDLPCDAVISNNYVGMYKMTHYLLERGHREIAFVGSIYANENIMDRYFGYRKGMMEYGISVKPEWVIKDRDIETNTLGVELPRKMPTAFVCNCDLTASILHDELKKIGYDVPEDISIVGYDNYLYGHSFANEVTTYNVDMEQMAKEAVHILLKRVKGISTHAGIHYVDSKVVERTSVKERTE